MNLPILTAFVVFGEPVKNALDLESQLVQLDKLVSVAGIAKLSILMSGSFAERCLTEKRKQYFLDLIQDGHEVGTYVAPECRSDENVWSDVSSRLPRFPNPEPKDTSLLFRVWKDNTEAVNKLVGSTKNKTVHSEFFTIAQEEPLLTTNSFQFTFADRSLMSGQKIGHPIIHPFRPSTSTIKGYELKENVNTRFVSIDGYLSVQKNSEPFHCPDLRPNTIANSFKRRYQDWSSKEDGRVWSFAFASSLNKKLEEEIKSIFSVINNYAGKLAENLNLIAKYATIQDIGERFHYWEKTNPKGTSSFSLVQVPDDLSLPEIREEVEFSQTYIQIANLRRIFAHIHKPVSASRLNKKPSVVVISGDGAITPGLSPHELAMLGFVVIHYDRAGKGQSSGANDFGGPNDQDDLRDVIKHVRTFDFVDIDNVGIISLGFGNAIATGTVFRHPDLKISYIIDWEGPSNRNNISKFEKSEDFSRFDLANDTFWIPREPYRNIKTFTGRYLRVQGAIDHSQGTDMDNAIEMVNSATSSAYNGTGHSSISILNGNPPNRIYNRQSSDENPLLWIQGESINRIAQDNAGNILKYFKNVSHYAKLNLTIVVTIPDIRELETSFSKFRQTADRLRNLANAFERAKAKLSILSGSSFVNGSHIFGDDILPEMVTRGHSVGSLINVPDDILVESSKQIYLLDAKSNIDDTIGSSNNRIIMGALTIDDPGFLAEIGFKGIVGPLLDRPHNIPRSAAVKKLNTRRSDPNFLSNDDPMGKILYLPGDLSKLALNNLGRVTNSIVISRNLIDPNKTNSWYIFFDLSEDNIAPLEQWATQDVGLLADKGDVVWKNLNEIVEEFTRLENRERFQVPDAPQNLKATANDHLITLSWKRSSAKNVKGYVVLRARNSYGKNFVPIATVHQTQSNEVKFIDLKAQNNVEYCYIVKAFSEDLDPIYSALSNEVCSTPRDILPPPVPKIIDFVGGNRSVVLVWSQSINGDTKHFHIYRLTVDPNNRLDLASIRDICDLRNNFNLVAQIDPLVFRFVDTGLTNGQEYIYTVSAIDNEGNESFDLSSIADVIPFENVSSLPLWIATDSGVSRTDDGGVSFVTINPCSDDYDLHPSIVNFLTPMDKSTVSVVNGSITVKIEATDPDGKGIQKVQVGFDEQNLVDITSPSGNPHTIQLDASGFSDGTTVSLFGVVTNGVGFVTKKSITVTLRDVTGPEIQILNPTGQENAPFTGSVIVQITATDPSGIDQISLKLDNGTFRCAVRNGDFWYVTLDAEELTTGQHTIIARGTDLKGNLTESRKITFNIDKNADQSGPQTTILSPLNGTELSGKVLVKAEVVDPSGVKIVKIQVGDNPVLRDMSFSDLESDVFLFSRAKMPTWAKDGSKIAYVDAVDGKLYEVTVNDNGYAGTPNLLWDVFDVPVEPLEQIVENASFEDPDIFQNPARWEIKVRDDAQYIVIDTGNDINLDGTAQFPLDQIFLGLARYNPVTPMKVVAEPGGLFEGPPVINRNNDSGLFIWYDEMVTVDFTTNACGEIVQPIRLRGNNIQNVCDGDVFVVSDPNRKGGNFKVKINLAVFPPQFDLDEQPNPPWKPKAQYTGIPARPETGGNVTTWHIAAIKTSAVVKGAISSNGLIQNVKKTGLLKGIVNVNGPYLDFKFEPHSSYEEVVFETHGPIPSKPFYAKISPESVDRLKAIELNRMP